MTNGFGIVVKTYQYFFLFYNFINITIMRRKKRNDLVPSFPHPPVRRHRRLCQLLPELLLQTFGEIDDKVKCRQTAR